MFYANCPVCGSNDKVVSVTYLHESGTSRSSTASGWYGQEYSHGAKGDILTGGIYSQSRSQTELSKRFAPPDAPINPLGCAVALIIGDLICWGVMASDLGFFIKLFFITGALGWTVLMLVLIYDSLKNWDEIAQRYEAEHKRWKNQRYCQRCDRTF